MSAAQPVTQADWDPVVLQSDKPVIVDFWAAWCGPCRSVAPVLDEIAAEHDSVKIVKLNVDENPDVTRRYGVMSIPTMMVFAEGVEKKRIVGFRGKQSLLADLSEFV